MPRSFKVVMKIQKNRLLSVSSRCELNNNIYFMLAVSDMGAYLKHVLLCIKNFFFNPFMVVRFIYLRIKKKAGGER